jgi:L-2-hydroxyglutarate oxidase LhgO
MLRCVVAGGGTIGLAISRRFSQSYETILLESSPTYGAQTSSRNSEGKHDNLRRLIALLLF